MSENTIHHVHVVLSGAMAHAVEAGYLRVSPLVGLPKLERPKAPTSGRELRTWTQGEVRGFLEATRPTRWGVCWAFLLASGVRRSELIALRWPDIDLDAGQVSVRRGRVDVGYQVHEDVPKNHRARVIALDPGTVARLRAHHRAQLAERLAAGPAWVDPADSCSRCRTALRSIRSRPPGASSGLSGPRAPPA